MSVKTLTLSEIAEINPSLGVSLDETDEVSFVPMGAFSEVTASVVAEEIRQFGQVKKGFTGFRSGDVIFAKITPCFENGKIGLANISRDVGFGSTEFHVIRARPEMADPRFLHHFLRLGSVRLSGTKRMTGSAGQRRVPKSFLESLPVPALPLDEQRRIAAILDQAEELRAKRRAALALLDQLPQAIFLEMFGDPATNPMGWPIRSVGDICEVKGGKRLPKGEDYAPHPTPFRYIRVTDLRGGVVDESNLAFLKPEVQAKIRRYIVNEGDVIISIAGSIGIIAPVGKSLDGANLTENAARLVPCRQGEYVARFLSAMLQSEHAQRQIGTHIGQVTIGKLALFRIEKIMLPLPPVDLQRQFANRIEAIHRAKATHQSALAALDALFGSLQHRAFAGELSPAHSVAAPPDLVTAPTDPEPAASHPGEALTEPVAAPAEPDAAAARSDEPPTQPDRASVEPDSARSSSPTTTSR